jgi:transposase-like protein
MERILLLNAVAKKYDEAFKRQAVEMVLLGGKTVKQAAEDLGVSQYSIHQWKKKFFPLGEVAGSIGKSSGSAGLPDSIQS